MSTKTETAIRERAYKIWEDAGRPEGNADAHWHQAVKEIDAPSMTTPAKPAKKVPAKKTVAKAAATVAKNASTPAKKAPAKKK